MTIFVQVTHLINCCSLQLICAYRGEIFECLNLTSVVAVSRLTMCDLQQCCVKEITQLYRSDSIMR